MSKRLAASSDEEDEEAEKRLRSCTVDTAELLHPTSNSTKANLSKETQDELKLCQARLQDMLQEYLDRRIEMSTEDKDSGKHGQSEPDDDDDANHGFHLFKRAPPGITINQEQPENRRTQAQHLRKPWIHSVKRWKFSDKYSSDSNLRLQSVAVDGELIKVQALRAGEKALAAWKANLLKKQEAQVRENQRVALAKELKGEKWLPSLHGVSENAAKKRQKATGTPQVESSYSVTKTSGHLLNIC